MVVSGDGFAVVLVVMVPCSGVSDPRLALHVLTRRQSTLGTVWMARSAVPEVHGHGG